MVTSGSLDATRPRSGGTPRGLDANPLTPVKELTSAYTSSLPGAVIYQQPGATIGERGADHGLDPSVP